MRAFSKIREALPYPTVVHGGKGNVGKRIREDGCKMGASRGRG